MGKNRIGVVVRESLGGNKSSSRSADLSKLYQNYQVWCKNIATLLQALKAHQQSLLHIEKTRTAVSDTKASQNDFPPVTRKETRGLCVDNATTPTFSA